ncbi:hypothetical protein ACFVH0_16165 [Streptomyces sp. NPDC127117]
MGRRAVDRPAARAAAIAWDAVKAGEPLAVMSPELTLFAVPVLLR